MGVKGLWSYVEHHHIQYAYPNKNARASSYGVNPRHLFIDMNAVMHIAYESKTPTTAATLRAVAARVDELLTKVRPTDTLVLVFDGVAPSAKLKTQKDRRRSLGVQAPRPASTPAPGTRSVTASSGSISAAAYTSDLTRDGVALQREEIVCGSQFVLACEEYVTSHVARRQSHETWRSLRVSGCREAGEGEVKISALLRDLWAAGEKDGTYSPDDAITIVGNDSDLILVAMVAVPYSYYTLVDPFDFSLTSLHELMEHWSNAVPNPPLSPELLPSYRVDFAFLMLLAGDDYYEGIRGDSVALWRRYRHLRANEGFFRRALLTGPQLELDMEFLRALFARQGSMAAQMACVPRNKRRSAKTQMRSGGGGGGGGPGSGSAKDGVELLSAALWSLQGYVTGRCADYTFHVQHGGAWPSVSALRSAAQTRGLRTKLGATGDTAANAPLFTPLQQCLAVLGVRGRYSAELSRAVHTCTPDNGHALTTSTSVSFVTEAVKAVMAGVDVSRLTEAERLLNAPSKQQSSGEEGEDGAFMRLAAIPSRRGAAAVAASTADLTGKCASDVPAKGEISVVEEGGEDNNEEEEEVEVDDDTEPAS